MRYEQSPLEAAKGRLNGYIEALWDGRKDAPPGLKSDFTQRLAAAAGCTVLLGRSWNFPRLKALLRQENAAFSRDLLSTDQGRAARAAFNLLVRAVAALEEPGTNARTGPERPEDIAGCILSSVYFVMDYVQLIFEEGGLSVYGPISVRSPEAHASNDEPGFRDLLCEAIGSTVRSVEIRRDAVEIALDGRTIELSLVAPTPEVVGEAATFWGGQGFWVFDWVEPGDLAGESDPGREGASGVAEIDLDASAWRNRDDFYDALLPALGAPAWHGRSLDALNDSIGRSGVNALCPPFRVHISGTAGLPDELLRYLQEFAGLIHDLKEKAGREVVITLE